jgi:transposase
MDPSTTPAFARTWSKCLAPTLRPGDVVVLDNLAVRKQPKVRAAIEAAGAQPRFLPPYSPDFDPIEMAFAKLKAFGPRDRAPSTTSPCSRLPRSRSSRRPSVETTSATAAVGSRYSYEKRSKP